MKQFPNIVQSNLVAKDELVKMLFYVGLQKTSRVSQSITNVLLNKLQKNFDSFNLNDTCIMASAIFKCSLPKANAKAVNVIIKMMNENLDFLLDNPQELICLLKVLRQQQYHDYDLLQRLVDKLEKWPKEDTLKLAHILSYFAEAKFAHNKLNDVIISSIENLNFDTRIKDIARILWVASALNVAIHGKIVESIWNVLQLKKEECLAYPDVLVNCLVSMAVLEYYNLDLTKLVLEKKSLEQLENMQKIAPWLRLNNLLELMKIECGSELVYPGPPLPTQMISKSIEARPGLKRIFFATKCLASKLKIEVSCQFNTLPAIHNAGIEVIKDNKNLSIEVLDPPVCLHNSSQPASYMKLKLRLSKKLNKKVLLVDSGKLALTDEELFLWLEDELVRLLNI
ncbi:uncharacterized protein LOC132199194 [Neocloeon triangulifer]|uniref:uncharacterized protein LOC132199194 n=1 Tax=Neocloeon triangulifer TaxID=2078957 RepID=UPI00286F2554|nr:uncharacterized protein LOC132199194 [Neocloeon triangulifer]